jgi:hypothetical protein
MGILSPDDPSKDVFHTHKWKQPTNSANRDHFLWSWRRKKNRFYIGMVRPIPTTSCGAGRMSVQAEVNVVSLPDYVMRQEWCKVQVSLDSFTRLQIVNDRGK